MINKGVKPDYKATKELLESIRASGRQLVNNLNYAHPGFERYRLGVHKTSQSLLL